MSIKDELLKRVLENNKIKRYQELEEIINNNTKIKQEIDNLKSFQKEIVHAKQYNKTNYLKELEKQYDKQYNLIIKHPLMAEYMDLQEEINKFIQDLAEIIENGINSEFTTR